ncbi:MAG: nucleoside hydrolase, partial [Thermomicrobium sp.]|nr:nucleoside hydrolase [Thermomicrobium sp.]
TAPEVIVRTARRYAGRLRVVCLGPLTNVAMAVRLEPRLPVLIERLVVMGGAFAVSGNVTPVAEFNVWSDPEAASIVIEAGFDAVWVGLDVTTIIRLTRVEWERLARLPHATARLVYEVSRWAFEECRVESYALHDPLAVAVAARPELVAGERARLAVMTSPEEKRGQTLYVPDTNATDVVATKVDAEAFLRLFRNSLGLADGSERVTARSAVDAP